MDLKIIKRSKCFEGEVIYFQHFSKTTKTEMNFSVFIPGLKKVENAIVWLSGLTCTEENFITKSGVQKFLSTTNTMIICPDTSPRGLNLPGEHESYAFGSGAGFYVNATTYDYKNHYRMYDYIKIDIVNVLKNDFKIKKISIMGHSMGGHGALVLGLREKEFLCISAFAPISNPTQSHWGGKAFSRYFDGDLELAKTYDATELVQSGYKKQNQIFIDQGLDDEFLEKSLLTSNFVNACQKMGQQIEARFHKSYDHSYYFVATFIEDHIKFHLKAFEH